MQCDKPQARWTLNDPSSPSPVEIDSVLPICSLCFLYLSGWGKKNAEGISSLVDRVEAKRAIPFERKDGVLVHCKDADQILQSIALVSRLYTIKRVRRVAMGEDAFKEVF